VRSDIDFFDMDSVFLILAIRRFSSAPLIIVSANDCESAVIAGFDAGADDYRMKSDACGHGHGRYGCDAVCWPQVLQGR
jgi:DNA-binding NarL/FixJ family response regulator